MIWSKDTLKSAGSSISWYNHFGKQFWQYLVKLKIYIYYNSAIAL